MNMAWARSWRPSLGFLPAGVGLILLITNLSAACAEASSEATFFQGKTITISTFTPPGGSYDTYSRMLARHFAKFIPGRPTVIVVNQPGAGGLLALNYAGRVAPRDGTFMTLAGVGMLLQGALGGQGMQVSLRDLRWIGNFSKIDNVLATWPTSKAKTIKDARNSEVVLGSIGVGSIDSQLPAAFNTLLGTRLKVISGYAGTPQTLLAMERGEIEGKVNGWTSFKSELSKERASSLHVLLQMGPAPASDLPSVPLLADLVKGDAQKEAVAAFLSLILAISRPLAAPPEVPNDRVAALRRAFDAVMKDQEFLSEAQKSGFDIDPMTGEEVEEAVTRAFNTPADVVARSKAAIEAPTR
jgi:tripartite-type tricarboxylate transporter receptor subunit TctC